MTTFKVGNLISYHRNTYSKEYCVIQKIDKTADTIKLWGVWNSNIEKARKMKENNYGGASLSFITVANKYNIQLETVNWRKVLQ